MSIGDFLSYTHQSPDTMVAHVGQSHGTALPTPPSSPFPLHPAETTVSLLENLVAFYHQERMWVYRTRASLELTLEGRPAIGGIDGGVNHFTCEDTTTDSSLSSTISSSSSAPFLSGTKGDPSPAPDTINSEPAIKQEPETPTISSTQTRWMRRKKSYKLKLEGISSLRRTPSAVISGRVSKPKKPERVARLERSIGYGVQMLELFESMMQARMESCERVTKMVRNASAARNQPMAITSGLDDWQ